MRRPFPGQPALVHEFLERLRIPAVSQAKRVVHALTGGAVIVREIFAGVDLARRVLAPRPEIHKPFDDRALDVLVELQRHIARHLVGRVLFAPEHGHVEHMEHHVPALMQRRADQIADYRRFARNKAVRRRSFRRRFHRGRNEFIAEPDFARERIVERIFSMIGRGVAGIAFQHHQLQVMRQMQRRQKALHFLEHLACLHRLVNALELRRAGRAILDPDLRIGRNKLQDSASAGDPKTAQTISASASQAGDRCEPACLIAQLPGLPPAPANRLRALWSPHPRRHRA